MAYCVNMTGGHTEGVMSFGDGAVQNIFILLESPQRACTLPPHPPRIKDGSEIIHSGGDLVIWGRGLPKFFLYWGGGGGGGV